MRSNSPGVLVECDPSIKAIILKIDQDKHDFIVEDLDDQTLVIKESQLQRLKNRLEEVRYFTKQGITRLNLYRSWQIPSRCQKTVDRTKSCTNSADSGGPGFEPYKAAEIRDLRCHVASCRCFFEA